MRSAPATVPPSPLVSFFAGDAAAGAAGDQATACVVTRTGTVATAVV
jgi:hypothetical protein